LRYFLIIIRKESNSSDRFLISSYLILRSEIRRYEKQLKEYEDNAPTGNEWFWGLGISSDLPIT